MLKWQEGKSSLEDIPTYWHSCAWLGSLGLGLSLYLSLARSLHFTYRWAEGITATAAFSLYPEQQDWWLYLLALLVVPAVTLLGYGLWSYGTRRLNVLGAAEDGPEIAMMTLGCLVWWIQPLTYAFTRQFGPLPLYGIGGVFGVLQGALFLHVGLKRRAARHPMERPPSLPLQAALAVLGGAVGVALLRSPWETPWLGFPLRLVLGTAVGLWGGWLGSSYWLHRGMGKPWRQVAAATAVASLPLSFLLLQGVLWWRVDQGGVEVSRTVLWGAGWGGVGVVGVVTAAVSGMVFHSLLKRGDIDWEACFLRVFFAGVVPLLLYMLAYDPNIHRALDLFHEGESVAPAQALMAGGVPYRDVVFVHGFLRDPGVALGAFQLWGRSIASVRIASQLLFPLTLVSAYYLALACLGRKWALLYSALALTGFWPFLWDWRVVPAMAALTLLVYYLRNRNPVWVSLSGFFAFCALATSFDVGLVALSASLVALTGITIFERQSLKLRSLLGYLLPVLACLAILFLLFLPPSAWRACWDWHREILSVYRDWNGMPFPITSQGIQSFWTNFLSPFVSVWALVTLATALLRRGWQERDGVVLLLLVGNVLLYNRGIVSGQEYSSALSAGSHLAPFLLLLLLQSLPSGTSRCLAYALPGLLVLAALVPTPLHPVGASTLVDRVNLLPGKNRVEIPEDWVRPALDRLGALYLPPEQAESLEAITPFLAQADSFWDFSDHGALYFLSDHTSPTRFYATHHVITLDNQREVIAGLEADPPRYIIFRSGSWWDRIAGVDRMLRNALVSEYILRTYHFADQIGGFTLLERGRIVDASASLGGGVDLGAVPFLWGRDYLPHLEALNPVSILHWDLTTGLGEWEPGSDIAHAEVRSGGWALLTGGTDPGVQNLAVDLDPGLVTYLALRMRVESAHAPDAIRGQLFWRSGEAGFGEDRSVTFDIFPDGEEHLYLLRLASFPGWLWEGPVSGLRLDLGSLPGVHVTMESLEFIAVDEFTDD